MNTIFTAAEAATELGKNKGTVVRACAKHGIGIRSGRQWVLTKGDIDRLRAVIQDRPGNPTCTAGNYFMGAKERPKPKKSIRKKTSK